MTVLLDFTGDFDNIWWPQLHHTLTEICIEDYLIELIRNYCNGHIAVYNSGGKSHKRSRPRFYSGGHCYETLKSTLC